jgi:hypothetical protein
MAISVRVLKAVRIDSIDRARINDLKARLRTARRLSPTMFERILRWKLRGQYGRTGGRRRGITRQLLANLTAAAFSQALRHSRPEVEIRARVSALCGLPGIGVPVASAILALRFPRRYPVVDVLVWQQVFREEKRSFSIADYIRYVGRLKPFARRLRWPLQEVDLRLWTQAYRQNSRRRRRRLRTS